MSGEALVREVERRFRGREAVLRLAWHAALPVAITPDLLHLMRLNFFSRGEDALSYEAEADLLLSPLCLPVGEDLFEIDPGARDVLLMRLFERYGAERLREIALLLWRYGERRQPWAGRRKLEKAQQLTVLSALNARRAREWLEMARTRGGADDTEERAWIAAMSRELARPLEKIAPPRVEETTPTGNLWLLRQSGQDVGRVTVLPGDDASRTVEHWEIFPAFRYPSWANSIEEIRFFPERAGSDTPGAALDPTEGIRPDSDAFIARCERQAPDPGQSVTLEQAPLPSFLGVSSFTQGDYDLFQENKHVGRVLCVDDHPGWVVHIELFDSYEAPTRLGGSGYTIKYRGQPVTMLDFLNHVSDQSAYVVVRCTPVSAAGPRSRIPSSPGIG